MKKFISLLLIALAMMSLASCEETFNEILLDAALSDKSDKTEIDGGYLQWTEIEDGYELESATILVENEEFTAFEQFVAINKDRDAYRRRNQELQNFKATFNIEKNNELEKRLNLEAVRHESEVNAVKGVFKREKEMLLKVFPFSFVRLTNTINNV